MSPFRTAFGAVMAGTLVLGGCASPATKVSVVEEPAVIVPGSAYAWASLTGAEMRNGDPRIDNDIIRERIRDAIDLNLAAKGYQLVPDAGAAQLIVTYHVGLKPGANYRADSVSSAAVSCGWRGCIGGYGWGMYGAPADIRSVHYVDGTLMVDLDRGSGKLAWRATSAREVDTDDDDQARIDRMVADLIKSLPGAARAT